MPFEITNQTSYLVVTLQGNDLENESPSVADTVIEKVKETQVKMVLFQCAECGDMSVLFLRQLAKIFKSLKDFNGKLCLLGPNERIREAIKKNGLDRILVSKVSLRGALIEFGLAKEKDFDVNFINPFLNATKKVLKIQCFLEATPGKPYLKKPSDPMLMGDLSGIIGITSEAFNGSLAISFPEKVFLQIAEKMLGETHKEINTNIVDLAGELSNMILGQAKVELHTVGYQISQALPSCVWGKDHQVKVFGGGACIVLPFETPAGMFHVEVSTNQNLSQGLPPSKKAAS